MTDLPIDKLLGSTSEGSTVYGEDAMSGQPTLYRDMTPTGEFSPRGAWVHDLVEMGLLVPVTEPLLTREEAANAMMAFLNEHGGDVGQHWPTMEDALKWLEAGDESA